MAIQRHSQVGLAAYHDLVSLLLDDHVSDIRGAPTLRQREGRGYWYDRYRIGDSIKERYLGEDTEGLRERIEHYRDLKEKGESRRRERARLVRLLRSERFLGLDGQTGSLIAALAKAGVFRLGGVMVGTMAFRLYEGELGFRLEMDEAAMTSDLDIASFEKLSLALGDTVAPSVDEVLAAYAFDPIATLDQGETWRWRKRTDDQMLVEFLTASFSDDEGIRELPALGVNAQSLHHLNYLIAKPISAAGIYRDGILAHVPRPERYAIHKLIVSDRRREGPDKGKAAKDLIQAERLIEILAEDRPTDLAVAYEEACSKGERWRMRLEKSLKRVPKIAKLLKAAVT
jgi:hypothetical protein